MTKNVHLSNTGGAENKVSSKHVECVVANCLMRREYFVSLADFWDQLICNEAGIVHF